MEEAHASPLLLYDGVCGFCNAAVQFIIARDREGTLVFSPLQSDVGEAVVARHPSLRGVDSVVWVERSDDPAAEVVYVRSAASLEIAAYLGGWWRLLAPLRWIPVFLRDAGYDAFARYRYRFFGRTESCMIPPRDVRSRFIGEL